jgi:serine protease
MNYNGGPVQANPQVYLLLWGPKWSTTGADSQYLNNFYGGLGVQPKDNWSTLMDQYTQSNGIHPAFSASVFKGVYQDTSTPPNPDSQTNMAAETDAFASAHGLTNNGNVQIVIAAQTGTCFADGFAGNPPTCANQQKYYCAWHTDSANSNVAYTNLPYVNDAGVQICGEDAVNPSPGGTYDGFSIVGGHEYAETVSDPYLNAWYDSSGYEIGDKCAWLTPPMGNVTLSTGTFAMQGLWSNINNNCKIASNHLTGEYINANGKCVDDSQSSNTNGNKIQIYTCNGSNAQIWSASEPGVQGEILRANGTCLDVTGDNNVNGTKVQLWSCLNDASQQWTIEPDGTIRHAGFCLDDPNDSTTNGTQLQIWSCLGNNNQKWTFPSQ